MKLLLIRHGETDWNIEKRIQGGTDIRLNQNGLAQAAALAKTLCQRTSPAIAIYTSPLARARQTADTIGAYLKLPPQCMGALREIDFGLWEGLTWEQVKERFPKEFEDWYQDRCYARPPQGESYQDLLDRFVPALQELAKNHAGGNGNDLIVVTHSGCIMSFLSLLNNTPLHEMAKRYKLSNTAIAEVEAEQLLKLFGRKCHVPHCNLRG